MDSPDGWYSLVMKTPTGKRYCVLCKVKNGKITKIGSKGERLARQGPFPTADAAYEWARNGWPVD